ncbi:diguanylate cyclase [bacterium]|nr:diguanylate cyclase [bacterium]
MGYYYATKLYKILLQYFLDTGLNFKIELTRYYILACFLRRPPLSSMVPHLFFKLENEKDSELEACEYLDMFAKKCGFSSEAIDEMRLAFIEGLINAKEHAPKDLTDNDSPQAREIQISLTFENDLLNINIRDFGRGFDPSVVEKPDIKKKLKSSYKRGWGIMLMERLMDGYEITSFPPSGTLMHLVKKKVNEAARSQAEIDAEKEHKRVERLRYILGSFIDLSSFLCSSKNLQAGLRSMLRILLGTMGVTRGAIYTFEKENKCLECLVDIKLRANARLPRVNIDQAIFEKLVLKQNIDIADLVRDEISQFKETFKEGEIERIFTLSTDNQNLGLLILGNRFHKEDEDPFDSELLTIITRNISSAINTYRLMQNLRETNEILDVRVRELDSVREASQTISSELEIENLPNTVESIFKGVMGINKFSMSIFDPTENRYNICRNNRSLPAALDLWSSPISQYVIQTMQPLYVPDITCEERFSFNRAQNYASNSFIVIPIVVQDEILAMVNLSDKNNDEKISAHDFEMAQLLCSQLGIALKNANLYKRGITDALTHLYTNHYFKIRLSQEISRLRRIKSPLSIIMTSIDSLESLIEKHGVAFRDAAFVKVGTTIKRVIRFNDLPCRFEGNKFAIIMPDTGIEGCIIAAEKILESMRNITVKHGNNEEKLTLSLAIVQFDVAMNQNQLLETADNLLAKTIELGGNRILTAKDLNK